MNVALPPMLYPDLLTAFMSEVSSQSSLQETMETLKISVFPLFPVSVLSLVNQLLRVALYVLLARI